MVSGPKLTRGDFFPLLEAVASLKKVKRSLLDSACTGPCEDALAAAQSREMLSLPSEDGAGRNLPWLPSGRD